MAYGDSPHDAALMEAWATFCDRLKSAGMLVFKEPNPASGLQRADGFRYLAQNLSQAFDLALETKDTRYPALHAFCSPSRKLGSDNADCVYLQAWIDGESVYKISGKKGTARFWNITVQGPRSNTAYGATTRRILHEPFGDTPEANIFGDALKVNWDGSFELFIGGEPQGQNWLPTTPGTRKLFLRQYFDSWDEEAADYRIERIGMETPRPMPDPSAMIDAMEWAGKFVHDAVDFWPDFVWEAGDQIDPEAINRFAGPNLLRPAAGPMDPATKDSHRGRLVTMMRWMLAEDEALILELDAYEGFWMITNESIFGNSMDYLYRPVSYTPSRTAVDADGRVRLVMAAKDPGFANWIDNQGFASGVLTFRNVQCDHVPELRTRTIKSTDIARHLPPDSKVCTPQERSAELHRRFNAICRRYRI